MNLDILTGVSHSLAPLTKFYSTWLWKETVVGSNESELYIYLISISSTYSEFWTLFFFQGEKTIKHYVTQQCYDYCWKKQMNWLWIKFLLFNKEKKNLVSAQVREKFFRALLKTEWNRADYFGRTFLVVNNT